MNIKLLIFITSLLLVTSLPSTAVEYALPDTEGNTHSFDKYRGKWVIANYWATWCTTCLKELPDLVSFHDNNKDKDAVVVGINFEDIEADELNDFIARESIPYAVLSSKPVPVTPLGRVPALPTTYIINPEGEVVAGDVGIITQQDIEDYIAGEKAARALAREL